MLQASDTDSELGRIGVTVFAVGSVEVAGTDMDLESAEVHLIPSVLALRSRIEFTFFFRATASNAFGE